MTRLVVFACGNESRGDDALGPILLRHIQERFPALECIVDFQLNIEHALDLVGADLALFIDADVSASAPFRFERLQPTPHVPHSTHALHPDAVLAVYRQLQKTEPPPSFVLGIRGNAFELGTGLSATAQRHLAAAMDFVERLLGDTTLARWSGLVTGPAHA